MRKTLLTVLCLGALYASASVVYNGAGETVVIMRQNTVSVKATPTKNTLSKDERAAISLITSMYNTKGFDNTAYLKRHCTKKLLNPSLTPIVVGSRCYFTFEVLAMNSVSYKFLFF